MFVVSFHFYLTFYFKRGFNKEENFICCFLVGYVAMPLDLIPDFLPFIGILDDIGIVLFILNRIVKMAPVQLQEKHNVNVG